MRKIINKNHYLIFTLVLLMALVIFYSNKKEGLEKIKIAVCPSFYETLSQGLNSNDFSVVLTPSTASSLSLLSQGRVDYVLGGRILRPDEPSFNSEIVGQGLSFLAIDQLYIYDYELSLYPIFSDLDPNLLEANFGSLKLSLVDNVYDFLSEGIIITSWDNTDYARAEIVHLLRADDSRNLKSRLPIVYCPSDCKDDIIIKIKNLINYEDKI